MIQYQLFDTYANELNLGDICQGTFPNEKVKVLGSLSLSNEHQLILEFGNGRYMPFHCSHMKVERIASPEEIPQLLGMRGHHQFTRKADALKWQKELDSILEEYLNPHTNEK